jgi:hypothetical protein
MKKWFMENVDVLAWNGVLCPTLGFLVAAIDLVAVLRPMNPDWIKGLLAFNVMLLPAFGLYVAFEIGSIQMYRKFWKDSQKEYDELARVALRVEKDNHALISRYNDLARQMRAIQMREMNNGKSTEGYADTPARDAGRSADEGAA